MEIPIRNRILYSLLFADNQVIFAQDEDDMRSMIKKLIEEYEKWGRDVCVWEVKMLEI